MIVNLQNDGWEVIYHRAHALLAAQIAGQWDFSKHEYRIYETIAAIAHHDNLEKEWDGDQLTKVGAPLDFRLERETAIEQLRRHVEESLYQSRWVAMLISMHLCFLHQAQQDDPEMAQFLGEQRQQQAQWQEELGISEAEAERSYTFMRWCDRLSLILSQRQLPAAGRKLEIIQGPEGEDYWVSQWPSGTVRVSPWPFTCDSFTISVEACYLSQLEFESNAALTQALKSAPRKVLSWTLQRSPETKSDGPT
ncbi:MAG: DUF3891 family protein [Leptolyngbyaceae cyanobacterium]